MPRRARCPIVLLDACVLYSAPVRDLLMWRALADVIRARWTDELHDEWIAALLRNRPDLTRDRLERTRQLMDENVRDALVTGYEDIVPGLTSPDPKDRHVLAAAIRSSATAIVTFDLQDFPEPALKRYRIRPTHPDMFLRKCLQRQRDAVLAAVRQQRASLKRPPVPADELLTTFARCGLVQFANDLRRHRDQL